MESSLYCYIIKLSDEKDVTCDGKIYVHASKYNHSEENIPKIFTEAYMSSEFFRKYTTDCIIFNSQITSYMEIDAIVKKYMIEYGIINVRGGSYYELVFPDYKLKILEEELCNLKYFVEDKLPLYNKIMDNYNSDITLSDEDIKLRIAFNKSKQEEYESVLLKYNKLKYVELFDGKRIELSNGVLMEFEFLKLHIDTFFSLLLQLNLGVEFKSSVSPLITTYIKEDSPRYESLIKILKKLPALFIEAKRMSFDAVDPAEITDSEILEQFVGVANVPIVKNPGLQFDRFFNHWYIDFLHNTIPNEKYMESIKKDTYTVLNIMEYMYHTIINKTDEYKFDLSTYNIFYENEEINEYKMNIYYYESILASRQPICQK